jgi:hypothetical protein
MSSSSSDEEPDTHDVKLEVPPALEPYVKDPDVKQITAKLPYRKVSPHPPS